MEKEEENISEAHAIVKGHVQGVFFRATTRDIAHASEITGTVENLEDGTVEIYAQGKKAALERFFDRVRKEFGTAHISDMEIEYDKPESLFTDFRIVYS